MASEQHTVWPRTLVTTGSESEDMETESWKESASLPDYEASHGNPVLSVNPEPEIYDHGHSVETPNDVQQFFPAHQSYQSDVQKQSFQQTQFQFQSFQQLQQGQQQRYPTSVQQFPQQEQPHQEYGDTPSQHQLPGQGIMINFAIQQQGQDYQHQEPGQQQRYTHPAYDQMQQQRHDYQPQKPEQQQEYIYQADHQVQQQGQVYQSLGLGQQQRHIHQADHQVQQQGQGQGQGQVYQSQEPGQQQRYTNQTNCQVQQLVNIQSIQGPGQHLPHLSQYQDQGQQLGQASQPDGSTERQRYIYQPHYQGQQQPNQSFWLGKYQGHYNLHHVSQLQESHQQQGGTSGFQGRVQLHNDLSAPQVTWKQPDEVCQKDMLWQSKGELNQPRGVWQQQEQLHQVPSFYEGQRAQSHETHGMVTQFNEYQQQQQQRHQQQHQQYQHQHQQHQQQHQLQVEQQQSWKPQEEIKQGDMKTDDEHEDMFEASRILISGLAPETSEECLFNFLDVKSGAEPLQLTQGHIRGRFIVEFKSKPDFERLQLECRKRTLDCSQLQVARVRKPSWMKITGLGPNITEDGVSLHFENKKNGGVPVRCVKLFKYEGMAYVQFDHFEDAKSVCEFRTSHKMGGFDVEVSLFYECLGFPSQTQTQMSDSLKDEYLQHLKFTDIDTFVVRFLQKSEIYQKKLNTELEKLSGKLKFEEQSPGLVVLYICSTVGTSKIDAWKTKISAFVHDFISKSELCSENVSIPSKHWREITSSLNQYMKEVKGHARVYQAGKRDGLAVAGEREEVNRVLEEISSLTVKAEKNAYKEHTEVTRFKAFQTQFVVRSGFKEKLIDKYKVQIHVDLQNNTITLKGSESDCKQATLDIHEYLGQLENKTVLFHTEVAMNLLSDPKTVDFIEIELKTTNAVCVWVKNIPERKVEIYAATKEEAKEACSIVVNSIKETSIPCSDLMSTSLKSVLWVNLQETLTRKYQGKLIIVTPTTPKKVICVATNDIFRDVMDQINNYFQKNMVHGEIMSLEKPVLRYFKMHKSVEIRDIEYALWENQVRISSQEDNVCGLKISGTREGIKETKQKLDDIWLKIVHKEHIIKLPGIQELFTAGIGSEFITSVEMIEKCVLEPKIPSSENVSWHRSPTNSPHHKSPTNSPRHKSPTNSPHHRSSIEPTSPTHIPLQQWTLPGSKTVSVIHGDITQLQVDGIVNAANKDLKHYGGVAEAIVKRGGNDIQRECDKYIRKYGSLPEGGVMCSGPGELACKVILHTVGPVWQGGDQNESDLLETAVTNCLEEAQKNHLSSLALPALSTGIFKYPLREAVKTIVEALKVYLERASESISLKEVILCDVNKDTVYTFVEILEESFSGNAVGPLSGEGSVIGGCGPHQSDGDEISCDSDTDSDGDTYSDQQRNEDEAKTYPIEIVTGELAEQKADVLVNPTGSHLQLNTGAVSRSLLMEAGQELQTECDQLYPEGIALGDIAKTGGGNLACKQVYHGVLKKWDQGKGKAEEILMNMVRTCLKNADQQMYASIAFPALGTGKLNFPADISTRLMFQAAMSHFENRSSTSVQEVYFVIHPKDRAVQKAFEAEKRKCYLGVENLHTPQRERRQGYMRRHRGSHRGGHRRGISTEYHKSDLKDCFRFRSLQVTIVQGSIVKETTDCIVNSCNESLNLTKGAVSRALLEAAGPALGDECLTLRDKMKKTGLVLTSAGNLSCKAIVHVKTQGYREKWKKILVHCLDLVNSQKMTSLSIPALGTGGQRMSPDKTALAVRDAIKTFVSSHNTPYLKQIRLVIFQEDMVKTFKSVFSKRTDSLVQQNSACTDLPTAERTRNTHSDHQLSWDDNIVISFYAESDSNIKAASDRISKLCTKEYEKKVLNRKGIENLSEHQVETLKSLANKCGVMLTIERASITLFGFTKRVLDAYDKVEDMLHDIEKRGDMAKEATVVSSLVQWYYTDSKDKDRPFTKGINCILEKAYMSKQYKLDITDLKGRKYKVDLKKMEEYPEGGGGPPFRLFRSEKGVGGGSGVLVKGEKEALEGTKTVYFTLEAERKFKDSAEDRHFRIAESQVYRLLGPSSAQFQVTKVDYVVNPTCIKRFKAAQDILKKNRGKKESEAVLAFHGTKVENIKLICEGGFKVPGDPGFTARTDSGYYGSGVYFSEFPAYSMGYIQGATKLLLCKVLQGKVFQCSGLINGAPLKSGYDSHISPDGKELVIFNSHHILPSYIVHYMQTSSEFKYSK